MGSEEQTVLLPLGDMALAPIGVGEDESGPVIHVHGCSACGREYLPMRPRCLDCGGEAFESVAVAARGTLYSFSTVHVSSSRPVPYTIGYVDLTPGLRVLADIDGDPADFRCDMPVELVPDAERLAFVATGASA